MARFYPQESRASMTPSILDPLIARGDSASSIKTRLLRVFSRDNQRLYYDALREEVNMCFFQDRPYNECDYLLPLLASRSWRLQTINITSHIEVVAPTEIWKMPQLRHINISNLHLPDPPPPQSDDDMYVLQNLQTLKTVKNLIFTKEVCKRIPNIKELCIYHISSQPSGPCPYYHLKNLGCFNKLELLHYHGGSLHNIKFPSSLKELTLWHCKLQWSYMAVIALLPHLQFLCLGENAVAAAEWVLVDERFDSLKDLHIIDPGLVTKWIAQSSTFPVLEELTILSLSLLDEIPSCIGEIATLQSITLYYCSKSVNISAVKILYEQEMFENLGLRVTIVTREADLLREKIQELDLTCQNLRIDDRYLGDAGSGTR